MLGDPGCRRSEFHSLSDFSWESRVQALRGDFCHSRGFRQLRMKVLFQNSLVLRGWPSSGGRLLLPGLVVEAEGIKGPTNQEVNLSCLPRVAFPAPHWVKDSETGTEAVASGGGQQRRLGFACSCLSDARVVTGGSDACLSHSKCDCAHTALVLSSLFLKSICSRLHWAFAAACGHAGAAVLGPRAL